MVSPFKPMAASYEIFFVFHAGNEERHASQVCDNDWLLHKLDVGSPVTIAYLPKNPKRSIVLETFAR